MISVLNERDTLELIRYGRKSVARFGDGEIKIALYNGESRGQVRNPRLAMRLREVAAARLPNLVVAIPRIYDGTPKEFWQGWRAREERERRTLWRPGYVYGSAFISRPDAHGEPFGPEYWAAMRALWQDRPVLLVRGNDRKPALFDNAASVEVLIGPNRDAWADYSRILHAAAEWAIPIRDSLVVLMLGPTATVLAHDLCKMGVQALDLGKAPRFYAKELGTPCTFTSSSG